MVIVDNVVILWVKNGLLDFVNKILLMLLLVSKFDLFCKVVGIYWKIVLCLLLIGNKVVLCCFILLINSCFDIIRDFLLVSNIFLFVLMVFKVGNKFVVLIIVDIIVLILVLVVSLFIVFVFVRIFVL